VTFGTLTLCSTAFYPLQNCWLHSPGELIQYPFGRVCVAVVIHTINKTENHIGYLGIGLSR